MRAGMEGRSIRSRIVWLTLAILLPMAATLAWLLVVDLRQARAAAREDVRALAAGTVGELQHLLNDTERVLARLAERPAVQALDAGVCELQIAEHLLQTPAITALALRDLQGRSVCGRVLAPAESPGVPLANGAADARGDRLSVSAVYTRPGSGERVCAWSYPIRSSAGVLRGALVLEVDLLALNRQLFAATPPGALVTVVDASQAVVLRSADAERFIGQPPATGEIEAAGNAASGWAQATGHDGVPRLAAYLQLPRAGWQVAGSLPQDQVFALYHQTLQRTLAIGAGLTLVALVLAWRLSAAIVRPVFALRDAAVRVAAGDVGVRSPEDGPPELRSVAQAFNRMLDARTLSESRLRGIFDSAVDAIVTADETQHIVEANPAAARMFGCRVDQMLGAPLERFIPLRFRSGHRDKVQRFGEDPAGARHMGVQREVLALRADGQEFPIEASISHQHVGERHLYTVIHRDVTERRRVAVALLESEARLRQLLRHLPEAVFVNSGDRISFVNQAACQLFGSDEAGLLGRSPLEFIHADSRALAQARIARLSSTDLVAPLEEMTIVRADGTLRVVQSLATRVEHEGDRSILVVMRDITDLKIARAELEASHGDLTRLVDALDKIQEEERKRIARELHDDLQQTLAAIRMDLGSMAEALDADRARVQPLLVRVDELAAAAIGSTRRIINDLRPQMLEDLGLMAALEALAARFGQRMGVDCALELTDPDFEDADLDSGVATCLFRVAQEALNNVAKHARAGRVRLLLQRVGTHGLRLVVSDDGQGLDAQDLRKPQSFGLLGMRERVRAAGGTLRIEGVAGSGTRLEVEFAEAGF